MSVSDVIARRGYTITLSRPGAVTVVKGYALPGSETDIPIFGTVQPLSGEQLRNLAEGQNATDWRAIWSLNELKVRDKFGHGGASYTIEKIDDWSIDGLYWGGQAVRVKDALP